MFPRRYFPGKFFAPLYWPQSQGQASVLFNPDIELTMSINRTASLSGPIVRRIELNGIINRTIEEESELT